MRRKPACGCWHLQAGQGGAEALPGDAPRATLTSSVHAGFLGLSFPLCEMQIGAYTFQGYCEDSVS